MSKYFTQQDFNRCTPKCSIDDMKPSTLDRFDKAREIAGIPFVVNSAYRTEQHEKNMGRTGTSSHIKGRAMDIACNDSVSRWKIVHALQQAGFNRIGIARTFVHADDDPDKLDNVIWVY